MINFWTIFCILAIHWVADFVLQTHEQAISKSSSNRHLLEHTLTYSMIWYLVGVAFAIFNEETYKPWAVTTFAGITFVAHTVTDWFTSRWCKKYFSVGNYHNGFVVVGIDQILHYIQLFACYIWLT